MHASLAPSLGPTRSRFVSNLVTLLRCAFKSCKARTRKSTENSSLLKLPVEILQIIASELPLSSRAALACTNRSLGHAIGTTSWHGSRDECFTFFSLLERDLPDFWACPCCCALHPKSPLRGLNYHWNPDPCKSYRTALYIDILGHLCWAHIHLAVKQHIHGSGGIPVDALSHTGGYKSQYQCSTRGKIIDNEVILKTIYLANFPTRRLNLNVFVCGHVYMAPDSSRPAGWEDPLKSLISCRFGHSDAKDKKWCSNCEPRVRRCPKCETDYEFTTMRTQSAWQVVFEVWQNFGSCQVYDDPKWQKATGWGDRSVPPSEVGTIRAKYEMAGEQAFAESNLSRHLASR